MSILNAITKKKTIERRPVQAKLDVELMKKIKDECKKDGISMTELIEAGFKTYLMEKGVISGTKKR